MRKLVKKIPKKIPRLTPVNSGCFELFPHPLLSARVKLGYPTHGYGNIRVGDFDSLSEARRWTKLRALEDQGVITELEHHTLFKFGRKRAYEADFTYKYQGHLVVEDVKHPRLLRGEKFRRNCQLMLDTFGLEVIAIHPAKVRQFNPPC